MRLYIYLIFLIMAIAVISSGCCCCFTGPSSSITSATINPVAATRQPTIAPISTPNPLSPYIITGLWAQKDLFSAFGFYSSGRVVTITKDAYGNYNLGADGTYTISGNHVSCYFNKLYSNGKITNMPNPFTTDLSYNENKNLEVDESGMQYYYLGRNFSTLSFT